MCVVILVGLAVIIAMEQLIQIPVVIHAREAKIVAITPVEMLEIIVLTPDIPMAAVIGVKAHRFVQNVHCQSMDKWRMEQLRSRSLEAVSR